MNINLDCFENVSVQECIGYQELNNESERQYLLSLLIKPANQCWMEGLISCNRDSSLAWLVDGLILVVGDYQNNYNDFEEKWMYLTVRHGIVDTVTDDHWHVDGFSTRKPSKPDINYVWCNNYPTEFLQETVKFPHDFDTLKYNVNHYIQDHVRGDNVVEASVKTWFKFDSYSIHRRPLSSSGKLRTFVRVSFLDNEIKGSKSEQDFNVVDFRDSLSRYK